MREGMSESGIRRTERVLLSLLWPEAPRYMYLPTLMNAWYFSSSASSPDRHVRSGDDPSLAQS